MLTTFLTFVFQALYFFLPAYVANMAPVFATKLLGDKLALPMDFHKTFRGKRILGDHKTWRGLVAGVVFGALTSYLQGSGWLVGSLLGLGAIVGDAVKSFFKRQKGLESGAQWPIFDQLDFVVGGLLLVSIIQPLPWSYVMVIVIVSPLLHILVNIIGFKLKIKDRPW